MLKSLEIGIPDWDSYHLFRCYFVFPSGLHGIENYRPSEGTRRNRSLKKRCGMGVLGFCNY